MSIIKCPECKRKVSDKASNCPKCGFSVKDYKPTQEQIDEQNKKSKERKRRVKKIIITTVAIITSLCIICCAIYIGGELWYSYQQEQEEKEYKMKYPLFSRDSYILSADPYGLTNEYNVIGKQISTVLGEGKYVENEDYTISTEQDYTAYTFPLPFYDYPRGFYPIAHNPELVLYTSNGIIFKVEYTFRLPQSRTNSLRANEYRIRENLTDYYDVDPIYTGYNFEDGKYVIMTKDEYDSLHFSDYYDVTFITWNSEKGMAMLSFTNMFDEKDEYGAITFTNDDEIKKEEYKNYIDKYNPAM